MAIGVRFATVITAYFFQQTPFQILEVGPSALPKIG
jgi:hypothetical protein